MRTAIVTGAFGFAGANLVMELISSGFFVYAVGRPGSSHNDRFSGLCGIKEIFLEMEDYDRLPEIIDSVGDNDKPQEIIDVSDIEYFFHLAWGGDRNDRLAQEKNIEGTLKAFGAAFCINPGIRFIATGSQAEYGVVPFDEVITEETPLSPITAYGSAKAETYRQLLRKSKELSCDFIWARIFSLIGRFEPSGRMFPDLINNLKAGKEVSLSSCTQYWDYLDARDAARALIALAEHGRNGEAYNIASATPRPLKDYVEEIAAIIDKYRLDSENDRRAVNNSQTINAAENINVRSQLPKSSSLITYGPPPSPFISLRPSITKIVSDTSWNPAIAITQTIEQNYMI